MERDNQTVYIIDTFDKYEKDNIIEVFKFHGNWYAIKEVSLSWGRPVLSSIEKSEDKNIIFCLYNTLEEARCYKNLLKTTEGAIV